MRRIASGVKLDYMVRVRLFSLRFTYLLVLIVGFTCQRRW